jgi:hypothetical protein
MFSMKAKVRRELSFGFIKIVSIAQKAIYLLLLSFRITLSMALTWPFGDPNDVKRNSK